MAAKESVWKEWVQHTCHTRRSNDLVKFGPGETCDFLATALSHPRATVRDASHLIDNLIQAKKQTVSTGGGDNQFFYDEASRTVHSAVTLAWRAMETASISHVHEIVSKAPTTAKAAEAVKALSESDLPDDELKKKSLLAYGKRTIERKGLEDDDVRLAVTQFLVEHHQTSEKQRAATCSIIKNLTSRLLSDGAGAMFSSGETSCGPLRIIDQGAVVVMDMPLHIWGESGRFAQIAMKLLLQKYCLMRPASDALRPVVLAEDEFATWALARHDSYVQSVSRESKLLRVAATQTVGLMRSEMGGDKARDEVAALIANHGVRVFASNSDPEVNAYASSLCGGHWVDLEGGSMPTDRQAYSPTADIWGNPMPNGPTISWSMTWRPTVEVEAFNRLERGGNGWVEAMVFMNGKKYPDTNAPYTWAVFDQNFMEGS